MNTLRIASSVILAAMCGAILAWSGIALPVREYKFTLARSEAPDDNGDTPFPRNTVLDRKNQRGYGQFRGGD